MKDIKQRIQEIRRNNLSIEQTGYLNGNADLVGESEFIEALIEEIIKPLCKDAFEDSRMREEVFNSEGWPELRGYVFKDAKDWLKENLK